MNYKCLFIKLTFALSLLLTQCTDDLIHIEGSGDPESETLELDEFTSIHLKGVEDVIINWGPVQKVEVYGNPNIIRMIRADVRDQKLILRLKDGHYRNYELKYIITLPRLNEINNEGLARVVVNDFINTGDLDLVVSGAGKIELNRMENTAHLGVQIEGLGLIKGYGEFPDLDKLDIHISGSGSFLGFPIESNTCTINIEGTGKCEVNVREQLDVVIEGAGMVHYYGNPVISKSIKGLGSVVNSN